MVLEVRRPRNAMTPWRPITLFMVVLLLASFTFSIGCSKKNQSVTSSPTVPANSAASSDTSKAPAPTSKTTSSAGTVIKLKKVSFVDQQGTGTEAFSVLIPADWRYEGGIQWVLDNTVMPATAQCRVWNPGGTEQIQGFPDQIFFWTDNQLTLLGSPPGSRYFGALVKTRINASHALKELVIPVFRSNVQGLKIVSEQEVDVTQPTGDLSSALQNSIQAAKARIEYVDNGKAIEDDIYCAVESMVIGDGTWWWVKYAFSARAEKGQLDANEKIFQTILRSVQPNLQWFNTYNQIVQYLIKMQIKRINSLGELGSMIAQTGSEIRQENLDLYNQRQEVSDRISNEFSNYMLDVDNYYNPLEQKNVELPTGYDNVWTNNLGEYVLSESSSYNPNVGSNLNWQKIDKVK